MNPDLRAKYFPEFAREVASPEACFQKASCAEKITCLRTSQEVRCSSRARAPGDSTPEGAPKMM